MKLRPKPTNRGTHHVDAEIAVAACAFELQADGSIQLTPWGKFSARDGRPFEVEAWLVDERNVDNLLTALRAHKDRIVIDYEHQTLYTEKNGMPAPAAGWFHGSDVEARPGQGLFVVPEWTTSATKSIDDKEYLYFSPVLKYNKRTGEVLDITMGAVTNFAAIDGMNDLHGMAAAKFLLTQDEEPSMEELLKLFGLKPDASEDDAIVALKALQEENATLKQQITDKDEAIAAAKAATPDTALEAMKALQGQVAALTSKIEGDELEELVTTALSDGRLVPAQEKWARKQSVAALSAFLEDAPQIAALAGSQTNDKDLDLESETNLSETELAVCSQMGVSPEDYQKNKEAH